MKRGSQIMCVKVMACFCFKLYAVGVCVVCVCPGHVFGLLQVTVMVLSYIYPLSSF